MSRSVLAWLIWNYKGLARIVGTQEAARMMQKQGIPLAVALATLTRD